MSSRKAVFFSSRDFAWEVRAPSSCSDLGKVDAASRSPTVTILFISLSSAQSNLEVDWAEAHGGPILRQCPVCVRDSIIGHGRRRKQAHDEDHDWIQIRRGLCNLCGKTFTFLPPFSPPYCHYSLIARSQALQRYFVEGCGWEAAAPAVNDPQRVADPSTLRRWFRSLDSSQPPFSFLRTTMHAVSQALGGGKLLHHGYLRLCWQTLFACLNRFWPLRL
ncbi:MAG: DUF6431 domain-containing protein [Bryobacteraceae bacterium]